MMAVAFLDSGTLNIIGTKADDNIQVSMQGSDIRVVDNGHGIPRDELSGESFALQGDRMTVGRRPDSDIFLDDVTVSRDHAVIVHRAHDYYLDDCGSLNGTYVNRKRIESHRLADGDELQVGKYKLAFLSR